MSDMTEWMLACIAEDEAVAKAAAVAGSAWRYTERNLAWEIQAEDGTNITHDSEGLSDSVQDFAGPHIARNDPAHVLAVCKAHRSIVELHPGRWVSPEDWWACSTCGVPGEYDITWPCETIRALATIYADRPGWREEWAS